MLSVCTLRLGMDLGLVPHLGNRPWPTGVSRACLRSSGTERAHSCHKRPSRFTAYLVTLQAVSTASSGSITTSLDADEMGTAAALLKVARQWRLAGWNGKAVDGWPQRLVDMAAVETAAARGPGEGERLASGRRAARRASVANPEGSHRPEPIEAFRPAGGVTQCC